MREVKASLAVRQRELAAHEFFRWLETTDDREAVAGAFARLAFWVSTFQDVLALNEARMEDVRFREIAWQHRRENLGHDKWFFDDLRRLGVPMASRTASPIRVAVHAVMAEVFYATSDVTRMTLLLALESASHVFLEASADWAERTGATSLEYFSRFHVEITRRHELFAYELDAFLASFAIGPDTRDECIAVVERVHAAFRLMFDTLCKPSAVVVAADVHPAAAVLSRATA